MILYLILPSFYFAASYTINIYTCFHFILSVFYLYLTHVLASFMLALVLTPWAPMLILRSLYLEYVVLPYSLLFLVTFILLFYLV